MNKINIIGDEEIHFEEEETEQSVGNGTIQVQEASDLSESMKAINDDSLEAGTQMSKIDMKTRLHPAEIEGLLGVDTLVSMGVLTKRCLNFTRQKKRLAVSEGGKGRTELVDLARGKREDEAKVGQSAFQKMGSMFTKG